MHKTTTWISIIVLIVLAVLLYKGGIASRTKNEVTPTPSSTSSINAVFYDQATGEAVPATFGDKEVTFTLQSLGTLTLPQTISADGGRYANADESIVFWNKGNSVFITENGKIIFNGSEGKPDIGEIPSKGKLPAGSTPPGDLKALVGTWVWQKNVNADGSVVTPKSLGVFALTLTADGKASGKTDCNGFGGEYTVGSDGVITFGSFMSTLMYCEGSQEQVFSGALSTAVRYTLEAPTSLIITMKDGKGKVYFTKK